MTFNNLYSPAPDVYIEYAPSHLTPPYSIWPESKLFLFVFRAATRWAAQRPGTLSSRVAKQFSKSRRDKVPDALVWGGSSMNKQPRALRAHIRCTNQSPTLFFNNPILTRSRINTMMRNSRRKLSPSFSPSAKEPFVPFLFFRKPIPSRRQALQRNPKQP